jgi:hypothetical protein
MNYFESSSYQQLIQRCSREDISTSMNLAISTRTKKLRSAETAMAAIFNPTIALGTELPSVDLARVSVNRIVGLSMKEV